MLFYIFNFIYMSKKYLCSLINPLHFSISLRDQEYREKTQVLFQGEERINRSLYSSKSTLDIFRDPREKYLSNIIFRNRSSKFLIFYLRSWFLNCLVYRNN